MAIMKDLVFVIELLLGDSFGISVRLTAVRSILLNNSHPSHSPTSEHVST